MYKCKPFINLLDRCPVSWWLFVDRANKKCYNSTDTGRGVTPDRDYYQGWHGHLGLCFIVTLRQINCLVSLHCNWLQIVLAEYRLLLDILFLIVGTGPSFLDLGYIWFTVAVLLWLENTVKPLLSIYCWKGFVIYMI